MTSPFDRGKIELTKVTTQRYKKFFKRFNGLVYYTGLPVVKTDARKNKIVMPDGIKKTLCF